MKEQNYKTWYESDNITFNAEKKVFFSQCNPNKRVSFFDVLKFSSDLAVEDYAQQGMTREMLVEKGYAVLVSRVSYRFHRWPKENEEFVFTTSEEKSEALQLVRNYNFTSKETGEKLISGISSWLLADPVKHRIIPTKKFDLRRPIEIQKEHDCLPYGKIHNPENMEKIDERIIRYSDLDCNGHTNNARYGAFLFDALPPAYREKDFTDIRLNYALEAKLDQKLEVFGAFDDEAKKITVVGKTQDGTSFESELFYK